MKLTVHNLKHTDQQNHTHFHVEIRMNKKERPEGSYKSKSLSPSRGGTNKEFTRTQIVLYVNKKINPLLHMKCVELFASLNVYL